METGSNLPKSILDTGRRQWIAKAAAATGALILTSTHVHAASEGDVSRTAEAIHQETIFKASVKRVYDALVDAEQFQRVELLSEAANMKAMDVTGKPAAISREPGGAFSLFGAHILGRQIELVPNQRIVQAWRVSDWDPGVYSIARFELSDQGSGTKLVFDHVGFPAGNGEHLAAGWKSHYWEPLQKFLA
jgi:activator of HSP90 ATPase